MYNIFMNKFLTISIGILLSLGFFVHSSAAISQSLTIYANTATGELSGISAGNNPSFDVQFSTGSIPSGAVVGSALLVYSQNGISAGLVRIIDKYSVDIIDSKALNQSGENQSTAILEYLRSWINNPIRNMGLLFQASSFGNNDLVSFNDIRLQVSYTIPDLTPPQISGDVNTTVGANTAIIEVFTDKPSFVNLDYGRTSQYGESYATDNVQASFGHLITLANLLSGSTYHYRFIITDESNNKTTSDDYSFDTSTDITQSNYTEDTSISPPQNLIAEPVFSANRFYSSLSWNPSTDGNVKGYIVYKAGPNKTYKEIVTLDENTNTYLDPDVSLGSTYFYYVKAFSTTLISTKGIEKPVSFPKTTPNQIPSIPATLETLLIIIAAASIIVIIFYLIIKIFRNIRTRQKKRLKNVLKDPSHYLE